MNSVNSAPLFKRFLAFCIDFLIVYLFRFLYINIILYFIKKSSFNFFNFNSFNQVKLMFFFHSKLFKIIVIWIIGYFLLSSIYHICCLLSKRSASVGQRIFNLSVVSSDNTKLNLIQIIIRSVLAPLPWMFLCFVFFIEVLYLRVGITFFSKEQLIMILFIFSSWYDLVFFTKNRTTFLDIITKTQVVSNSISNSMNTKIYFAYIFPNFTNMYFNCIQYTKKLFSFIKNFIKKLIK